MKKIYALIIATFLTCSANGTHLMGGEMTVEHLGGNDYVIHFQAYRDTLGINFALDATFNIYDVNGIQVLTTTSTQLPISGQLMPGYPYGVEIYFFHDTITVPGPGEYTVEWWNCCRNGAIQNLLDPLSENMYLTTTFTNVAGVTNSSPEFLAPPVTYLPVNQPWQYNSLPFDVDGDSLSWSIDTPLTSMGTYAAGYVTPSAATLPDAFTIDAITGEINWTPDLLGNFVASILVEEFDNGIKIGEIRRDYQMIVVADTTKCPRISNFDNFPKDANDNAYMYLTAHDPASIILLAEDPEGDAVEFLAYGEPLLLSENPAHFLTQGMNNSNKVMGCFNWTPLNSQAREKPYIVVFRTRDAVFTYDETVLFYVSRVADTEPNTSPMGNTYPSPASNLVFVPLHLENASAVSLSLYGSNGSRISEFDFGNLPAGKHVKEVLLNVSAGTYFITLSLDGKKSITRKLVIAKH